MHIKTRKLESFPAGANPFSIDLYNMGTPFGKDLILMHANHPNEECTYFNLVNTKTGERIRIEICDGELAPAPCGYCHSDRNLEGHLCQHCGGY